jgi:chaperonin GroES
MAYKIDNALYTTNIAEDLDEEVLTLMGHRLCDLVNDDDMSRQAWLSDQDEWIKLAAQVRETKDFPWERASNVKYPLVSLAALQFHARALPGLINSSLPVQAKVLGEDPQLQKRARADRVRRYMSYQILDQMEEWMDEMDRMMIVLPIIGLCYKKTYYSENLQRCRSILVLPRELIVNYHATDYNRARLSHVIMMDQNELRELQLKGIYLDVDLTPEFKTVTGVRDETVGLSHGGSIDLEDPYEIIESHCWWDLDNDGYKEPYIVTFHRDSRKVLRIVARWEEGDIEYNAKGKISKIKACDYFTPYMFFPDPNSAVYGLGFGRFLGPTNEAVNTLINQLIDAGTLSVLQSGFLARGIKLTGGSTRFKPGEWKVVNTTGDDLRKGIVPMPVRDPSPTLFQLLGMLIDSGQRLSSVSDMMTGENPGQNQPASTTMAVLEQGLKVFTGIYKRIHRSLAAEYRALYKLNYRNLDVQEYQKVLDAGVEPPQLPPGATPEQQQMALEQAPPKATIEDFNPEGLDIIPASDPNFVTDGQKSMKAQALLQKVQMGLPLNIQVVTRQVLESEGHENIMELMNIPPPSPPPEFQLEVEKTKIEAFKAYHAAILQVAQAEAAEAGSTLDQYRAVVDDHAKVIGLEDQLKTSEVEREATKKQANAPKPAKK